MTGISRAGRGCIAALLVGLIFAGCTDSSDRGLAGSIIARGGATNDTLGIGGDGGLVYLWAGDNIYLRAGQLPDPEISSNTFAIIGNEDASTVAGAGITNVLLNGVRTITSVSNFVVEAGGVLSWGSSSDTLLVIVAPTIHILGTIDLSGRDSLTVGTRGKSLSLVANQQGGEVYITGTIDTQGGSGQVGARGGHISISTENCGTGSSSPGLTATGDVVFRGRITTNGGDSSDESASDAGNVWISACNDIFLELLEEVGIETLGGNGVVFGGDGGSVYATASNHDDNGSIVTGTTMVSTGGGSGRSGGDGGSVRFTLVAKSGNTGTGDIWNNARIDTRGGTGLQSGSLISGTVGGNAGAVVFTTYDSGQNIENEGAIDAVGGPAIDTATSVGGDGDSVWFLTDADGNELGGMIRNEAAIDSSGADGVLAGGDGGHILMDTDIDDGEDATNGEGENLGNLTTRGGDAAAPGSATSSTGGDAGQIRLRARGAFQTNGILDTLGGTGVTDGLDSIAEVD